ncbi:MAG: VWA domain-containing protein [Planctomycetota bacterium]
MFLDFFQGLRAAGVPVTITEHLAWLQALEAGLAGLDPERFYYLARAALVKDERFIDRFDRVFGHVFRGLEAPGDLTADIPESWLRRLAERLLDPNELARLQALGSLDELLETLRKRLAEQQERHEGGSRWIGTGGTSPFGAYGANPLGVRMGQHASRHRRAAKVWDQREFRDFAEDVELGTRQLKVALRGLRKLARRGHEDELDLPTTIRATARNAGWLDLQWQRSRENVLRVLLVLDVGGSMDDHVRRVEELFSAARSELKHLDHVYFHNCLYERVWRDNHRRHQLVTPTEELFRHHDRETRVVFVGDASMGPFELTHAGGSVEHWNEQPGISWLRRAVAAWPRTVWINPVAEDHWTWTPSIGMVRGVFEGRMVPLTLAGVERAIDLLT